MNEFLVTRTRVSRAERFNRAPRSRRRLDVRHLFRLRQFRFIKKADARTRGKDNRGFGCKQGESDTATDAGHERL